MTEGRIPPRSNPEVNVTRGERASGNAAERNNANASQVMLRNFLTRSAARILANNPYVNGAEALAAHLILERVTKNPPKIKLYGSEDKASKTSLGYVDFGKDHNTVHLRKDMAMSLLPYGERAGFMPKEQRRVLLHEFVHTRQPNNPKIYDTKRKRELVEGQAEDISFKMAPVLKTLGYDYNPKTARLIQNHDYFNKENEYRAYRGWKPRADEQAKLSQLWARHAKKKWRKK